MYYYWCHGRGAVDYGYFEMLRVGFLVGYFEYDVDREDENADDSRVEKEGDVDESDCSI